MEKKKPRSFVQGAAILGAAGLLVKIIGAFFRIPLSNSIGPIGMSYYEVAYPYYSWLLVISSSGFPTAISKLVSERVTLGDAAGARAVFRRALGLLACIGAVTSLVMFFAADGLAAASTFDKASLSFKALSPALLFVSVMCAFRGYLQGMQQMSGTAVSQIVEQVVKLLVGLTLAIRFLPMGPEYAAMGALIGVSISEVLALIVIALFYLKKRSQLSLTQTHTAGRRKGENVTRALLSIAIPITIGASISPLTGIVDSALIGRILTDNLGFAQTAAQTAYSLLRTNVTTLVNMPGVLTVALAMSLVPAISAAVAERDIKAVRNASRLGLKLALIIGLPCAVGLFVLAAPVLRLLYPNLSQSELSLAAELLKIASIGVVFLSLVQTLTGVIQGMGRPNVPVFNLFIGFVLKVAVMLILMNIPDVNILGAAISTVACYAFAGVADTVYAIRKTRMRIDLIDVALKPLASALLMGLAVSLVYSAVLSTGHDTTAAVLAIAAGVAVYAVMFVLLKMFSPEELASIPGGGKLKRIMYRKER